MQATFKISAEELDDRLLQKIKKLVEGKPVTITITTEADETTYLTANEANKNHLLESMASEPEVTFSAEEFEKHVEELLEQSGNSTDNK
ncbi:MAG: hypothetical protein K9I94_04095 [Bacteroidales bacterium]|nr:hypothetical protein [Bacteroidales bacterium]